MPRSLNLARLQQFEPIANGSQPALGAGDVNAETRSPDAPSSQPSERWLSREPVRDGQISIKAPLEVIERFRRLCHDDRRTYADMLAILMENYERPR